MYVFPVISIISHQLFGNIFGLSPSWHFPKPPPKLEKSRFAVNPSKLDQTSTFLSFHSPLKSLISLFWHFTFVFVRCSLPRTFPILECCYCYWYRTAKECAMNLNVRENAMFLFFVYVYVQSVSYNKKLVLVLYTKEKRWNSRENVWNSYFCMYFSFLNKGRYE